MSASKTFGPIEPAAAQAFYKEAITQGWEADTPVPDFAYDAYVEISGYGLKLGIKWARLTQMATVTILNKSVIDKIVFPDDVIFERISELLASASKGLAVDHQNIWSNVVVLARPHFRIGHLFSSGNPSFAARDAALEARAFHPSRIGLYYGIQGDGEGQTIRILEFGGAYYPSDTRLAGFDPSRVTVEYIDGAQQIPGDADGEVALDVQIALAVAPKAKVVVYFAPNSEDGFFNATAQAYKDSRKYCPTFVASGDNGANDGQDSPVTDFPASAPYAIGCGGTRLTGSVESVWNNLAYEAGATGGGVSAVFQIPDWQKGLSVVTVTDGTAEALKTRGVPDVAANGDPISGYIIYVNGQRTVVGGTSAVAPLMAGVFACLGFDTVSISWGAPETQWTPAGRGNLANLIQQNAMTGDNILPKIYANPALFKNVSVPGDNGDYEVTPGGWNAATGLGSPDGPKLFKAFKG